MSLEELLKSLPRDVLDKPASLCNSDADAEEEEEEETVAGKVWVIFMFLLFKKKTFFP